MDHPLNDLIEDLVCPLVARPERVELRLLDGDMIEVAVAPSDRGRIIGRQGRTLAALQTLVDAVATRRGLPPCRLEVAR